MSKLKLAVLALTTSLVASTGVVLAADSKKEDVTVVLVHGAWSDASSWNKVIPLLQKKGVRVMTVQNPLTSLADDVAATRRIINDAKGKVVLVGHSWAGTVITEAGNDPKVANLVYVAAFAPDVGETGDALIKQYPTPPALSTVSADSAGFVTQTEQGVLENFAPDIPKADARILAVTQGPLAVKTFGETVSQAAWKNKPSWYIVSRNDRVISPELEAVAAKRMNATTTVLASSHVSLLSHPKEVAAVIEEAVTAASK